MLDERSLQTVSTPLNTFKNKENVEAVLNESLTNSSLIQQAFKIWFNEVLKQTLKPFLNGPLCTFFSCCCCCFFECCV